VSHLADATNSSPPSGAAGGGRSSGELSIGLVLHSGAELGEKLFNNYGAKSNAELILGYGFTLPRNPDDTISLKIGGMIADGAGKMWEVGRNAAGAEAMWDEMLAEMTQTLLERLPDVLDVAGLRPEVAVMREHYVEGAWGILRHGSV
jgi:hypothetical protein